MTTVAARVTAPRRPALDHDLAMRLAAEEYQRVVRLLRALPAEAWSRPSECPGWDVRLLVVVRRVRQRRLVGIQAVAERPGQRRNRRREL